MEATHITSNPRSRKLGMLNKKKKKKKKMMMMMLGRPHLHSLQVLHSAKFANKIGKAVSSQGPVKSDVHGVPPEAASKLTLCLHFH